MALRTSNHGDISSKWYHYILMFGKWLFNHFSSPLKGKIKSHCNTELEH